MKFETRTQYRKSTKSKATVLWKINKISNTLGKNSVKKKREHKLLIWEIEEKASLPHGN